MTAAYVELACASHFSFLHGASNGVDLLARAFELGHVGLGIADRNTVAGVVRVWLALKDARTKCHETLGEAPPDFKLVTGARLVFADGTPDIIAYPETRHGWGRLCRLLSTGNLRADKGDCVLRLEDLLAFHEDLLLIVLPASTRREDEGVERKVEKQTILPPDEGEALFSSNVIPAQAGIHRAAGAGFPVDSRLRPTAEVYPERLPCRQSRGGNDEGERDNDGRERGNVIPFPQQPTHDILTRALATLRAVAPDRVWLGAAMRRSGADQRKLAKLASLARNADVPLLAINDALYAAPEDRPLQDVLTAIRLGIAVQEGGKRFESNAERHLKSPAEMARLFRDCPEAIEEALRFHQRIRFDLEHLKYEYPHEPVPNGWEPLAWLRHLVEGAALRRWPDGVSAKVRAMIEEEFKLIATRPDLPYYFLTVHDLVRFARSKGILCQGRGSAANSMVCYLLDVTPIDPAEHDLLFSRFMSEDRDEPPDIDVDFEHERREEVIQYLYNRFGRDRAALTAAVISYRPKSAMRDVGKALGIPAATLDVLCESHQWWDGKEVKTERLEEAGLSVSSLQVKQLMRLTSELMGMPRHLSQHVGGFVLTRGPLSRIVPIENASMADRTVIQWDKDDIDAMGLLKVDVLALGMLTAIRKSLEFISMRKGYDFGLQDVPAEDGPTYDMICKADTVGVFQIESRAQRTMLPRLKPRCFYDLVVEVALVRPGPIQGGAVHPYLARRQGLEPVSYPSEALKVALERTLGVAIFQEQVMQLSIIAAGFTPGEADGLRRAMAAWRRKGGLEKYYDKIINGMTERGYELAFAQSIFEQIKGFSEYGFPESHAASFALLVYASCWIKAHHPGEFLAALLNSQPMGFYAPDELVIDAQEHGIQVRGVDVMHSDWDCTLEGLPHTPAVRLGMRLLDGMRQASAERIMAARRDAPFESSEDLALRAGLEQHEMRLLAAGDALISLSGHRRQQVWDAAALKRAPALLSDAPVDEDPLDLPAAPEGEEVVWDYASTGLTLRSHPLALLRPHLRELRLRTAAELHDVENGRHVRYAGIVKLRQQPDTASGVVFMSLQDESGTVQVVCFKRIRDEQREPMLKSRLLGVYGTWQSEGPLRSLVAEKLVDLSHLLGRLKTTSRDFH